MNQYIQTVPELPQIWVTIAIICGGSAFTILYIVQELWTTKGRKTTEKTKGRENG